MPIKAEWIDFRLENIKALALKESGVYEVGKKRGDVVLYIGMSDASIRERLLDHKEKAKFTICTHFRKRKTSSGNAADAEKRLMDAFCKSHNGKQPKLNTQRPTTKTSLRQPYVPLDKIKTLL